MSYNRHIEDLVNVQDSAIDLIKNNCIEKYGLHLQTNVPVYNETLNNFMCPAHFDSILCWPPQMPNTTASIPCPAYMIGFIVTKQATRQCMENAQWYMRQDNSTYTNYSQCFNSSHVTIFTNNIGISTSDTGISDTSLQFIKILSKTGYCLSLISLIFALIILLAIKRLHCPRNILHMNLFSSFILRSLMHILKDTLFVNGIGLEKDVIYVKGLTYFHVDSTSNNFECKLIISLLQYCTTANYSWILMEGLYLSNLILRPLITDATESSTYYIWLGWGLPILVVIPWISARILFEDTLCWTTNDNIRVYAVLMIPILVSVLLNFILFLIISTVLYKKLKYPVQRGSQHNLKWAKSTLILVPLFGINYAACLIFYLINEEFIWMVCDTFLGTFQGFFVSILYCFSNGEVKSELQPYMKSFLIYSARNKITKHCFPCREKYLSSAAGRPSVCTTMSYGSLYNKNGIISNKKNKNSVLQNEKTHQEPLFIPNNFQIINNTQQSADLDQILIHVPQDITITNETATL